MGGLKRFNFPSCVFGLRDRKVEGRKTLLYKFTLMPLLDKKKFVHYILIKKLYRERHFVKKKKKKMTIRTQKNEEKKWWKKKKRVVTNEKKKGRM